MAVFLQAFPATFTQAFGGGLGIATANIVVANNTITIIYGDAYTDDPMMQGALEFTTTRDYRNADSVILVIHAIDDITEVYQRVTCSVIDEAAITASFTVAFDLPIVFSACDAVEELAYALIAVDDSNEATIERGNVFVYGRPEPA